MAADPTHLTLVSEDGGPESITSRAYAKLKQDIISGTLKPGSKLKIEQLRQNYNVGSSPVREALSLLTSDHLVERIDQRGFRVADVSQDEYSELLKTRCWLEERALRESVENGGDTWEEGLILANHRLSKIPRSVSDEHFQSNEDWESAHKSFHMALISECGSNLLLKFCDQLYDQNIRYRLLSGTSAYPSRNVSDEHSRICDAALARNANLAAGLLVEHYQRTREFVLEGLATHSAARTKSKSTL